LRAAFKRFEERYKLWWQNINFADVNSGRVYFHLCGWFLTFVFIIFSIEKDLIKWMQVWIVFHFFFWYQLNKLYVLEFKIPPDLLLLFILSISSLQNNLLNTKLFDLSANPSLGVLPTILLSLQILLFGFILTGNSSIWRRFREIQNTENQGDQKIIQPKIRQGSLIVYMIFGYLAFHVVLFEHEYIKYLFQFFLLLSFLNKTHWLEALSKPELIVEFWLFLFIFYFYSDPSGLNSVNFIESIQYVTWFGIPYYIHLLIKMYLLAVVIKIPVVIIYNHATLSRKMWIAGLFQSTFPQLIQFVFLCFVFFSLISSWQAENLRETLKRSIEQIKRENISSALTCEKIPLKEGSTTISMNEYLPVQFPANDQDYGVIKLIKTRKRAKQDFHPEDYFMFIRSDKKINSSLYLVKIDTSFTSFLTKDLSLLAGSGLILYPFAPKEWQQFIFNQRLFQQGDVTKIYPFGIKSLNTSWSLISARTTAETDDLQLKVSTTEDIFGNSKFILGRVFIPVSNAANQNQAYFALDIYINLQSVIMPSTIGKIIWAMLFIFILFNSLVIGQVGKFGSQINKIILQKFSQLKIGIQQIATGNLDYKFKMEGEDEFVELAGHFNEMSIKLKSTIAEAREKERLDHELKIARQVQIGLLPAHLPKIKGFEIAASIKTANEIGGDFYDILPVDSNKYVFTIGDVSGKGSSAAFYMAQFISLFRYSCQFTLKPDDIAVRMNKYFSTHIVDRQIFTTAIIGILDVSKNTVEFVRAGHTLPILVPGALKKEIVEIQTKGLGLGLTKREETFKNKIELKKITLKPGDMLIFYTDGVIEAAHPGEFDINEPEMIIYGEERFLDLVTGAREMNAQDLNTACIADLNAFYKDHSRVDDHTLFFLQRKK